MDFDLFLGLGRLIGALGGSIVSSMTRTTPSSVSELLFFTGGKVSPSFLAAALGADVSSALGIGSGLSLLCKIHKVRIPFEIW